MPVVIDNRGSIGKHAGASFQERNRREWPVIGFMHGSAHDLDERRLAGLERLFECRLELIRLGDSQPDGAE